MSKERFEIEGQYVDLFESKIFPARLFIDDGKIQRIDSIEKAPRQWLIPGFVDAHVHIESSMLAPSEFAPLAMAQGTIATISDPHEIGNVLGIEGVRWMVYNGKTTPFYFHFGAPSCVPATIFETAGSAISVHEIETLFREGSCQYLAEMMNWPGVIYEDAEVMAKLELSKKWLKPIDGHAPGLRGEQARAYFAKGIQTDHECFALEEAREKAFLGVKILIREGSAARNFDALIPIIKEFPDQVMFCSDDKHPDDLIRSHINGLVSRAISMGYNIFDVYRSATILPMQHYQLPCGKLRIGDSADFVVLENLEEARVSSTYIKGVQVFGKETGKWKPAPVSSTPNAFHRHFPSLASFAIPTSAGVQKSLVRVIEAVEGQLITKEIQAELPVREGSIQSDPERDILKIAVVNRYQEAAPALAFIQGFGLKEAAIASSVAHDSHNIVVVGSSDILIKRAVDALMKEGGGICLVHEGGEEILPLPVAGLMSDRDGIWVGEQYEKLTALARKFHSTPKAAFMLLSFMALLVIPALKLSDKGLFNGLDFRFVDLEVNGN